MKQFLCTKDCIEACRLEIDDNLLFFPKDHPSGYKFICPKLKKFLKKELIDNKDESFYTLNNIKYQASQENVIKIVSKKLAENHDKRILYIRGSGSLGYMNIAWDLLFSHFPNIYFVEGSLCLSTGQSAHIEDFGIAINPSINNLKNVENIILFGRDAWNVAIHQYAFLKNLKKQGKKILLIDPIKNKTARLADDYLKIEPATDAFLVNAILKQLGLIQTEESLSELLKICNINIDQFETALKYITNGKTAIITGYGLQRYSNGKNIVQWINRLAYLTNNLDNLYYCTSSKEGLPKPPINNPTINISELLEKLENNFFHMAIIVASNPIISYPSNNRLKNAFKQLEHLIVVDTNKTETVSIASDFIKVGGMFAQKDISGSYFYPDRIIIRDKIINHLSDYDAAVLVAQNLSINLTLDIPTIPENKVDSKKSYSMRYLPLILPKKEHELRLITRSHYSYLNSQHFGDFKANFLYISPTDAEKYHLKDGDTVLIKGNNEKATAKIQITNDLGEGYIFAYKCQKFIEGDPNLFTKFIPTDSKTGIALYDTFVELEKL